MEKELYELTNPQKSIWLTEQYYKGTSINTICGYVSISEVVNFELLKKAINEVVRVNDSMRFKFKEENDSCVQYVQEYVPFDIDMIHLLSQNDIENETSKVANTPFNIDCSLFKFVLFDLPNGSGGFIISVHHLISDSWTLGLIVKEIMKTYSDLLTDTYENQTYPSYLNYIQSENDYKNSEKCQKDKAYWDEIFQTIPEIASITPVKNEQNKSISCKGNREKFVFSTKDLQDIKAYCDTHKISIYNFFMAVYSLYISRVCNLNDFVIGTPILNRTNFEQKHTTGMFISVAPLRINLNEADSFIDFSKKISIDTVSLFRHQKYSYQSILEDVRKKDSSIPNLYNIALSYQITKTVENFNQVHYSTDWMFNGNVSDELQIHLFDLNDEASMTIAYDYKSELFNPQEIRDLHARILTIIKQIISNEAIPLKDIEIVTPEEKHQILYDFNNTAVDYPRDKTIVDLFEEQVEKTPDNIAVIFEDKKLTYRELNEKANQLARYLLQKNVQIGDIVGIYLNKSLEVVVSMLAILKTGAAFLPIDIDYPEDRLNYIINHSAPKAILSSKKVKCNLNIPTIFVDLQEELYTKQNADNLNISITPEDLMYIMYTSGSTGNPKGVMVKHKNIIRLAAFPNFINFDKDEVMVQTGTIVFDACIFEIFGSLLHGFKLYILKKENILDIPYFTNFLEKEKVTILFLTTGLFNQLGLQNPGMFRHLKYLLTGGDVISKTSIQKIRNSCGDLKIINCYGPTENGSYSTCYSVIGDEEIIPIGKPITNSTAYVVSSFGNLCPIGVPGELWVGGEGVARGYLNNDDLTKEQFINNPFGEGLIYKTGDLVKWLPDGNIAFIGRIDNQVKIRGFRIELSEIDRKILLMNDIKQSLTLVQNINNTKTICSYIISDKQINIQNLRNSLGNYLPVYMIPTFIMQLEKFPLNINGKVDMKAFPIPNFSDIKKNIIPARNELDQVIIDVLSQVLNITNISIEDSFFDLGGDSLSAISFTNILTQKLNISVSVSDVFAHSVIKELSDYISTLSESSIKNVIKKADKRTYYPASNAQKRVYYASSVDNDSILYNIAGGIIVDKTLDINLLQKCFNTLIDRHEVLRTRFDIIDNDIVQIIDDKIDFTLSVESSTSDDLNAIYAKFIKPFDLTKAPLFRAKVVKLENNKMLLLLDMHHIISDGTSISILLQELCDLYNGNTLPEKQVDYKDFTLWEKEQFETEEFKNSRDFWVNQYQDEIPLLNMPTTYSRPSVQSFEGANCYTKLPKEIFEKVNEVSKKLGITPYMLMLSVYYILLSKYTSQDDIVVGTPIVGRELPELSNMLGMFVNTLALRTKIDHSKKFSDFANSIKEYSLSTFQNQGYPFDELVKELDIKRDTSRNPLVDVMFVYQNNGYPTINFKDVNTEYFVPDSSIAKFDLTLEIVPIDNELSLRFEYCTKLFDKDFISRLSSHYVNILNAILENSDIKIADIDMLSKEEKNQILYDFNNTAVDYPRNKTIVDLFEEQVEKTPDNIAIVFEDQKLTYRELNEKANQLANYLLIDNVLPNDIVCLLLDKSLESIIAIMAILKVGAAYLPIDVNYPSERIDYIIKNSGSTVLLTTKNNIHKSTGTIQTLCIDIDTTIYSEYSTKNVNCKNISPDSLAYIMYTSGSTGNPKGVMVSHRNIVRLIKNNKFIEFDKHERILQTGSIVFDACTFEIFGSLLNGFELYIIKKEELLDASLLQDYLIKNKITTLWLTAPLFNQLCEENPHMFSTVKKLLTGGDVLSPKHINMVRAANPNLTVINGYGPTENTTFSCCFTIDRKYTNSIPIGRPISNSTAYVVSSLGKLCPIGVPGELWVGGDGVGKGYLNNDSLTNEKFIKNPFGDGIIYKTGDLVKWLSNGTIDFIGRIDNQVKIRGFRVELGEINGKIASFPSMKECVTVVNNIRGEKSICSYIVSDKKIDIQELRQYLKRNLPVYMIPTYFMQLEKLPINTNGKVDRKLLPTNFKSINAKNKVKLPSNDNEQILLDIFKKLLCFENIGIDDDFFELGGDSLLAIKLQVEAVSHNLQINYADIFDHPTVEELAKCIGKAEETFTEDNFDYEKYNSILEKNVITPNMKIANTPIGNVLLTGFTGFLGAHVLDSFIKKETGTIYCLIRGKNNMSPEERLKNVLHFYFDTRYDKYIGNRIKLVEGDITLPDFGLNVIDYNMLGTDINTVIHCAALVKHYGSYKDFESINILGTKRVIDFSKAFGLKLLHISTISVSGNNLAEGANIDNYFEKDKTFYETNFYIGQNLSNFYVRSKFEAERLVLDAISDGLQACILRMGNLTSRFSEGKFQQNHFENAFVNKIRSFIEIGCVPDYLLHTYCEFTPIDFCGNAIIDIANHITPNYTVFHLLNQKHVYLDRLFKMLNEIGIDINLVSEEEFKQTIDTILKDEKRKDDLDGIINNLDNNKRFIYKSDVMINSDFTKEFLSKIGFEWPYIDTNYIRNYFKYLSDIGYFNLNIK